MATAIENTLSIHRYMYFRSHFLPCNLFWNENIELTNLTLELGVTFFHFTKRRKRQSSLYQVWLHRSKQNIAVSLLRSLSQEYPTLTTFFAGEIISRKRPFLTRKWDADEDVDRKHWVR